MFEQDQLYFSRQGIETSNLRRRMKSGNKKSDFPLIYQIN